MTTLQVSYPRSTDGSQVAAALRSLLAVGGSTPGPFRRRYLALELWATDSTIRHLITGDASDQTITALSTSIPGVRVEPVERPVPPPRSSAVGLRVLGPTPGVLRTDIGEETSTALLAALTNLRRGEHVVVQWLVGPLVRATRLSRTSEELDRVQRAKRSETEVVAAGRIAVWAADHRRSRSIASTAGRVLQQVSGPDGAIRMRPSHRAVRDVVRMRPPSLIWPSHLNISELASMVGWPSSPTSIQGVTRGASRLLPLSGGAPTDGPSVGVTNYPSRPTEIRLGTEGRLRHLHAIGPTGVGKTTLLMHLIRSDIQAGRAVVIFDPLGGLADTALEHIPENRIDDVVVVDPTDTVRPVGFNVLAGHSAHRTTDFIVGVMSRMFASSWGPRTADVLRSSLLTLSGSDSATLADLQDLLTNEAFRRKHVAGVAADRTLAGFWAWFDALGDAERSAVIAPVLNKVRSVVLRPEAVNTLCHPDGQLNLEDVFTKRRIVILRLAKGLIGEDTSGLIGGLILARLWQIILGRSAISPERRHPVLVYLDEVQDFLTLPVSLGDMLAQARGMGVGLVMAHQHLGQMPDRIRRDLLANTGSRVMFQTRAEDARVLARDLDPHLSPADLQGLAAREIVARVSLPDRVLPPVTGRTVALPDPISEPARIRTLSGGTYGRPVPKAELLSESQLGRVGRQPRRSS